ncbi:MAG: hypothetical protein ACR2QO_17065 [Acidimicrobiales bacterium]
MRSPTMLFDAGLTSWNHYEVYGQPTAVLVNASGEAIHTFDGAFDANEILARLG